MQKWLGLSEWSLLYADWYCILFIGCLLLSFLVPAYAASPSKQQKLLAHDGAPEDFFSFSLAIYADTALISAMHQDDKGANSGSAYIFTRKGNTWHHQANLTADDGAPGDVFGWSVALSNGNALIGATRNDDQGNESGSAYIFKIKRD